MSENLQNKAEIFKSTSNKVEEELRELKNKVKMLEKLIRTQSQQPQQVEGEKDDTNGKVLVITSFVQGGDAAHRISDDIKIYDLDKFPPELKQAKPETRRGHPPTFTRTDVQYIDKPFDAVFYKHEGPLVLKDRHENFCKINVVYEGELSFNNDKDVVSWSPKRDEPCPSRIEGPFVAICLRRECRWIYHY